MKILFLQFKKKYLKAGKKAQTTVEYVLLLCVIMVVSVTLLRGIQDWLNSLDQLNLQKAESQSYRNGKYNAGGLKEVVAGSGDAVKFHPRANESQFHIFKRTETDP